MVWKLVFTFTGANGINIRHILTLPMQQKENVKHLHFVLLKIMHQTNTHKMRCHLLKYVCCISCFMHTVLINAQRKGCVWVLCLHMYIQSNSPAQYDCSSNKLY